MIREIKISRLASKKLDQLFEYLETKWSLKVKKDFIKKLEKSLLLIQKNPEFFQQSTLMKGLYRCVVTKQITIYYKFDEHHIYIVTVFDNRQNPEKLSSEI